MFFKGSEENKIVSCPTGGKKNARTGVTLRWYKEL